VAGGGMEEGRGGWLGELPGLSSRYSFFFYCLFSSLDFGSDSLLLAPDPYFCSRNLKRTNEPDMKPILRMVISFSSPKPAPYAV
jgi:hypothetical protein